LAFVKDDPAKSASLAAAIQKLTDAHKDKDLRSFVVYVGGQELQPAIDKVAQEKKITIPLTFLAEGAKSNALGAYKINPEAKNTVMLYSKKNVQSTFVNVDQKSWADVEKATAQMLGK